MMVSSVAAAPRGAAPIQRAILAGDEKTRQVCGCSTGVREKDDLLDALASRQESRQVFTPIGTKILPASFDELATVRLAARLSLCRRGSADRRWQIVTWHRAGLLRPCVTIAEKVKKDEMRLDLR